MVPALDNAGPIPLLGQRNLLQMSGTLGLSEIETAVANKNRQLKPRSLHLSLTEQKTHDIVAQTMSPGFADCLLAELPTATKMRGSLVSSGWKVVTRI